MIYTASLMCTFSGFFLLYNTSRKAKLSVSGYLEKWMQSNPVPARILGILLIVASFVLLAVQMGTATGLLTAFMLLMLAASLIVAIAPLRYIRLQHVLMLVAGSLLLENLFH